MTLGPILGNPKCPHDKLTYYRSGYSGNYAVCHLCGGHLWGDSEEGIVIPSGVFVVDLDSYDDDEYEEDDPLPYAPVADADALARWVQACRDSKEAIR